MHALLNFHDKKTKNFYIRTALINFHNKKTKNFEFDCSKKWDLFWCDSMAWDTDFQGY